MAKNIVKKYKKNPALSVVMSVYNGEKYLRDSIDSILGQTFKDFEFIIIDDGSTDSTLKIIKDYAARNKKLPDELTSFERKFAQAEYITEALNKKGIFGKLNDNEVELLIDALTLNSQYLTAGTRSIAAGASLVARQSSEVTEGIVNLSNLDVARGLFPDIVQSTTGTRIDADRLDSVKALAGRGVSLVHFENFVQRFYGNTRNNKGIGEEFYFNPVAAFVDSKGLRTERDYAGAKISLL